MRTGSARAVPRPALGLAAVVAVLSALSLRLLPGHGVPLSSLGPAVVAASALSCAAGCLWHSRGRPAAVRRFLGLVSGAAFVWGLGAACWVVVPGTVVDPIPTATDVLWLSGTTFAVLAVVVWPGLRRSRCALARLVVDSATLTAAGLLVLWPVWVTPVQSAVLTPSARESLLLYPFVDVALVALLAVVGASTRGEGRTYGLLATLFAAGVAAGDHQLTLDVLAGRPTGWTAYAAWCLAWCLLAASMAVLAHRDRALAVPASYVPLSDAVLTGAVPVAAAALTAWQVVHDGRAVDALSLVVAVLMLAGMAARALLVTLDHRSVAGTLGGLAFTDPVTGLASREGLLASLRDRRDFAPRRSVLLVGVDGFGAVNERYGPEVGNQLLAALGERVRRMVGPDALVARTTGDEFAVVLPGSDAVALPVAERVLSALCGYVEVSAHTVQLTLSGGLAELPGPADRGHPLRRADLALRAAKRSARGSLVRYSADIEAEAQARHRLEGELRRAVATGAVSVVFQPIVDVADDGVVGFEALARWDCPGMGPVGPDCFIPVAERLGLIVDLGRHVLDRSCAVVAQWRRSGYDVTVAVNVSVLQLQDRGFVDTVLATLHRHELSASALVVEVTESVFAPDTAHLADTLGVLRTAGVKIAIDDFGTGYSSLSYLRGLPVDVLKLDASFTQGATRDPRQATLTAGVVELGHRIGTVIVAEGVELPAQAAMLRDMGCERGQGYLWSRPLRAEDATAFLAGRRRAQAVRPGAAR